MIRHAEIPDGVLRGRIRKKEINFGGNKKLKIYGLLSCASGKVMKRENRVFFISEKEAQEKGYRPCGHCMRNEFRKWKQDAPLTIRRFEFKIGDPN